MNTKRKISGLRQKFELQSILDTPDNAGGFSRSCQAVASIWGEIDTLKASAKFSTSQESVELTHRVTIRWRPDVDQSNSLKLGKRRFNIIAAHDADPRRRYLICHCQEVAT